LAPPFSNLKKIEILFKFTARRISPIQTVFKTMQVYKSNAIYQRLFPMLDQATTEKEFEEILQLNVDLLNDIVKATCSATDTLKFTNIYKKNELYEHFFPRLGIAPDKSGFLFCLDSHVKSLSEMIDIILKNRIANAYIKIFENETRQVYTEQALARIARQNEDLLSEESEEEEEPLYMDDIINEQYDAVFTFDKKSKQTGNKQQKNRKELPLTESSSEDEEEEPKKPPTEKKYKDSNFKKRKVSKLKMVREDKRALPKKSVEETIREEEEDAWLAS
jgi:hypothetical protein